MKNRGREAVKRVSRLASSKPARTASRVAILQVPRMVQVIRVQKVLPRMPWSSCSNEETSGHNSKRAANRVRPLGPRE